MSSCRVLCYFTIPGAGFQAGCGRSCLLGWLYRDVRWVTNQQKSYRKVRWPSACPWHGLYSGVVSVLVLSSGTKSRGFLATSYFLWKPFHKKLALRFCWGRVCVMALEWRPGKYKGKISVSVPSPHFLHQLTSLVSVWDRGQQGYEISWSGRQLSAVLWLWV